MGLFKTLSKFGSASKKIAEGVTDTFISPVARELIRPVVNVRSGIDASVPGGRTGDEAVATPFGVVKPFANLQGVAKGESAKEQGRLTGGEAAVGALEVATSGPAGTAKALLKPLAPAAKALGKVDNALGIGDALRASAISDIGKVLNPTKEKMKAKVVKIAPEILERGVVKTMGGLKDFAEQGLEGAGREFEAIGKMKGNVTLKPVLDAFEKAKTKYIIDGKLVDQRSWRVLDEIQNVIGQFGETMPAQALRELGRVWDEDVAAAGGFIGRTLDEGKEAGAKEIGANAIRALLAKERPDFAAINKTFTFFKNLDEVLEATSTRRVGQSGFLRRGAAAVVGAIAGSPGGPQSSVVGAAIGDKLGAILTSAPVQLMKAKAKKELADVLLDPTYSLGKIAEFAKSKTFLGLKGAALLKAIKEQGKMTPEEMETEEQEREQRIETIRQRLEQPTPELSSDGDVGGAQESTGAEREKRIEEIRKRLQETQNAPAM